VSRRLRVLVRAPSQDSTLAWRETPWRQLYCPQPTIPRARRGAGGSFRRSVLRRLLERQLTLLIIGSYAAGFLKLFATFVDEADEAARLPKAIVAVQPDVPDNTLIFIVFKDEALIDEASFLWNIRAPLRAEYDARVDAFPFRLWVSSFQYQSIPEGMSVRAFGYDGEKARELPELAARIIARQESYLGLESDVVREVQQYGASNEASATCPWGRFRIDRPGRHSCRHAAAQRHGEGRVHRARRLRHADVSGQF